MKRRRIGMVLGGMVVAGVGLWSATVNAGWKELWSGGANPSSGEARLGTSTATPTGTMAESLEQSFVRVAQEVGPAVVSISTEQIAQVQRYFRGHPFFGQGPFEDFFHDFFGEMPQQEFKRFGLGSGVIIDTRGYILTNEHVVVDADKITVTLSDGREFSGQVKGKDLRSDLAVVKIDTKNLVAAQLGNSDESRTGQWAIALGNPFGLSGGPATQSLGSEPTLTVGVISALHRRLPRMARSDRDYSDLVQTDAAINPGNSGGPLVNLNGQVIGINVAIISSSRGYEGIGFAIPVNKAKHVLDALIEGRKVLYGWLGIQIQDITQDVAEYYGLSERSGVLVYQVLPESPAQHAGLKEGDIVKTFDGKPVTSSHELVDVVGRAQVGQRIPVEILREGKPQALTVEVGQRPSEEELVEGSGESWRGIRVAELSAAITERFEIGPETTGVVVTEVEPGSPADDAHLQPGDVINELNRMPIGSLADYRQAISKIQGNALIRTTRGYVVLKAAP